MGENLIIKIWNRVDSDRSEQNLSDETIRIKICFSVENYDKKTAENYRDSIRCRKAHGFQTIEYIDYIS